MADETADQLREMAQHRGMKLVRSRRRKPGSGDFGKFGLTDGEGKSLLGIGVNGLTATAADIEQYLRAGAASTWQQSAKLTPDPPMPRPDRLNKEAEGQGPLPRERNRGGPKDGGATKSETFLSRSTPKAEAKLEPKAPIGGRSRTARAPREVGIEGPVPARNTPTSVKPKSAEPAPSLVLRTAKPIDAAALAKLLTQVSGVANTQEDLTRALSTLRNGGGDVHVAELGPLVGCAAWAVMPTLQRGLVGRISMLIVSEGYRRKGIGTRLLAEAEAALTKKGCTQIEAMSDIEIKNSHNFFRTLKFEQTSYRFARKIVG